MHVINVVGHTNIYPNAFSLQPNSSLLTEAMDMARGGQFIQHPGSYPEEAWYHYDDYTCDYECMAIEYLYWCIVSNMGLLDNNFICNGISNEWELCTQQDFQNTDLLMYAILTDSEYHIPQLAPDGNYCTEYSDLNHIGEIQHLQVHCLDIHQSNYHTQQLDDHP